MDVDVLVFLLGRQTFLERFIIIAQMFRILVVVVLIHNIGLEIGRAHV